MGGGRPDPICLFDGRAGLRISVATAHGEGQAVFRNQAQQDAVRWQCAAQFADNAGRATEQFPANPNGSPLGMTAFTVPDGRFTIMIPHQQRVVLAVTLSWRPQEWRNESPWMRVFRNARAWVN